jgi:hypothetical protein
MPGSKSSERAGGKVARAQKLMQTAKSPTTYLSWYEYFAQGLSNSVVAVGQNLTLYGVAKLTVGFFTPASVNTLIQGVAETEVFKKTIIDYGTSVIEDLVKGTTEYIGTTGSSLVSTPTEVEKDKKGLENKAKDVCETVGKLAALFEVSNKMATTPTKYCDDAYARARVSARLEEEMTNVKAQVLELKALVDKLEQSVTGPLQTKITQRSNDIKDMVEDTIKKGNLATHWDDDAPFEFTYRRNHCSKTLCYGPGPSSMD